ncbi:hypothetical protein PIB30_098091 [Stylosanthes scabra]|uniref:Uncharacterized protein n=1 Tax=Stylosanthes scabra TaxID=79078 RepID=A0ABU6RWE6_9FABA|nr:hypothetical protein [Stylosanthes scabra]
MRTHPYTDSKKIKGVHKRTLLTLTFTHSQLSFFFSILPFLMPRTRSTPLAKGKTKVYRPPTRASPGLASLRSQGTVQPQFQAPAAPVENIATSILPLKKCLTYLMAGEGTSRVGTKAPCRWSQRIATLHRTKNQASEEHEVIELSSDSEHEKEKNLEAGAEKALLAAEAGAEETLPKNNVYAALWAMLDAESESEAEEIPSQCDLDGVFNNWGTIEPDVGLAEND